MRMSRRTRPQLEVLESMTLLSALSPALAHPGGPILAAATTPGTTTQVSLNGTLTGDYHVAGQVNPDKGLHYVFSGNGSVKPLGHADVDVTGNLHSLGNVAEGQAKGLIVLSTPKGSLTLHLTGPEQKGFAKLPDHFTFKITNSFGKYDTSRRNRQPPGARRAWTCGERAVITLCRGFDHPSIDQGEPL